MTASALALFISVFLACAVEAVEATTIVLAAGTARDWKSAFRGVIAGLITLAAIIIIFGPAISKMPISVLRILVGGLLLVFGLAWLRKAILRASGYKALHDEEKIYREEVETAKKAKKESRLGVSDWYAFTLSYKGVLLEGLEVAFIVLTFGTLSRNKSGGNHIFLASMAALAAVLLTAIAGFALHKPLARVPENTMKFVVGILLTSFGIFWGAEGSAGVGHKWPGDNWAVLGLIALVAMVAFGLIAFLKATKLRPRPTKPTSSKTVVQSNKIGKPRNKILGAIIAFGLFWWDFIIGDDWRIALGIIASFILTAKIGYNSVLSWLYIPVFAITFLGYSLSRVVRANPIS